MLRRALDSALSVHLIITALGALIITVVVFPFVAYPLLRVQTSDANQMFVVPVQMMARAASDHPHGVTVQERATIDAFNTVSYADMSERYMPYVADPVIHLELKNPSLAGEYMHVWFDLGQRYPNSYINGFLSLQSGWFSLRKTPTLMPMTPNELASDPTGVRNQIVPQIEDFKSAAFLHTRQFTSNTPHRSAVTRIAGVWDATVNMPLIRTLTYTALWTWILPMFIISCCCARRLRLQEVLVHAPLFMSLMLLLLNAISVPLKPTASRYMMWALVAVPVSIGLLHIQLDKRNHKHQGNVEA
ncbi:DUF6020 family protein [Bifidobacterium sp.]